MNDVVIHKLWFDTFKITLSVVIKMCALRIITLTVDVSIKVPALLRILKNIIIAISGRCSTQWGYYHLDIFQLKVTSVDDFGN